ncbi:MAG: radical SAM protein [Bacteroidales bacterium]|jgi:MoaA/NifB/PqqE/SkfB family radical SAM enzyme|nr:radical SAM protein [Bacteroidales bacterium]
MKKLLYLAWWFVRARFFGRRKPLQTVLFISDKCNLRCKHCTVYSDNPLTKTYAQIKEELEYSYKEGARFVDFEGGEPFLWRDESVGDDGSSDVCGNGSGNGGRGDIGNSDSGDNGGNGSGNGNSNSGSVGDGGKTVNDLCGLARKIGFFSTTITTNAQMPFPDSRADSIWVSMDGTGKYHEQIRGEGTWERLKKNIAGSNHPHLSVNMVVNKLNYENVEDAIKFAKENPHIEKISINFHTPYEGTEHLYIDDPALRSKIIDDIIKMKRRGYPIMNSVSGLKLMKHNKFTKQCWVSNFIMTDGTRLPQCPGNLVNVCDKCGFCMAGEMHAVYTFKPDTLLAGFSLRL